MYQRYVARRIDSLSYALTTEVIFVAALILFTPTSWIFAATAATVGSPFLYTFNSTGTLSEAGSMSDSSSPYFWLNSGGKFVIQNGVGATVHGNLASSDSWRLLYAATNPLDTDNGYHPQNLFRFVSRSTWNNVALESLFKIDADNFSASPNRNASNGLLHMLRYQDNGATAYFAGVRVDGYAVIKKKKNGIYTTLATKKVYPGTYSVAGNVNLLPHNGWVAMRSEAVTNADGTVSVRLYVKNPGEGVYTLLLETTDASNTISSSGYVGMRTDFMDIEYDNFKATTI